MCNYTSERKRREKKEKFLCVREKEGEGGKHNMKERKGDINRLRKRYRDINRHIRLEL
jgi:hypothetical protein